MSSYRVLMLTSLLYRTWAKVRSRQLSAWTKTWTKGELYATAPGTGAADAHASYALRIELAFAKEVAYAGVVSDLTQAFDRLLRDAILPLAAAHRAGSQPLLARAGGHAMSRARDGACSHDLPLEARTVDAHPTRDHAGCAKRLCLSGADGGDAASARGRQ